MYRCTSILIDAALYIQLNLLYSLNNYIKEYVFTHCNNRALSISWQSSAPLNERLQEINIFFRWFKINLLLVVEKNVMNFVLTVLLWSYKFCKSIQIVFRSLMLQFLTRKTPRKLSFLQPMRAEVWWKLTNDSGENCGKWRSMKQVNCISLQQPVKGSSNRGKRI